MYTSPSYFIIKSNLGCTIRVLCTISPDYWGLVNQRPITVLLSIIRWLILLMRLQGIYIAVTPVYIDHEFSLYSN